MQSIYTINYLISEPPSLDIVLEEEDEHQPKVSLKSNPEKTEKNRPHPNIKPKAKGTSSSSSSSNSSMKSASSQPCLLSSMKKLPTSATKNAPSYGSAGKLHEIVKPKHLDVDLDLAEKRRQELLQQKVESSKK